MKIREADGAMDLVIYVPRQFGIKARSLKHRNKGEFVFIAYVVVCCILGIRRKNMYCFVFAVFLVSLHGD